MEYERQLHARLFFKEKKIGTFYLDFLVEGKIILELKQGNHFSRKNIQQVKDYLKTTKTQLAILANFTSSGVSLCVY